MRNGQGLISLGGRKIAIAAAHRQTIRFAHGGTSDDLHGQGEVFDHPADHYELLKIFLAKTGEIGRNELKQFEDDRGHTTKMTGPADAFERLSDDGRLNIG